MIARLLACTLLLGCSGGSGEAISPSAGSGSAGGPSATQAPERPRVRVQGGELEGSMPSESVRAFFGIPYAKPPSGPLRFRPPEPHDGWPSLRDASRIGPRCPQLPAAPEGETEDCLHLNVWTPAKTPPGGAPVMVWIHGGGHVVGSTGDLSNGADSEPLYSGLHLSAAHGVVVVTLNYRLGVLGFFAHEALALEGAPAGNQGLWDQQLALQWVQDNIAAFGGDPNNVTLFGESAGSVDVCLHVASPQSRGLFHRAISQSGACTTRRRDRAEAEQQGRDVTAGLGCAPGDALSCLRGKSVAELLDADAGGPLGPIADGEFLPEQPRALFDRGELAAVPYMLGTTNDEGSGFVADALEVNEETYLAELSARFTAPVEEIAERYPASDFASAPNPYFAALARAVGDARFVCPTQDTARRALAADLAVYLYNFDIPFDGPDGVFGAVHASELGYVFGTWPFFTPETRAVSDRMMAHWSHFAQSGDPNGEGLASWPPLDAATDVRINFGLQSTLVHDFRAAECEFWRARFDAAFAAVSP
jgi:para-nitrobenzyl esterase